MVRNDSGSAASCSNTCSSPCSTRAIMRMTRAATNLSEPPVLRTRIPCSLAYSISILSVPCPPRIMTFRFGICAINVAVIFTADRTRITSGFKRISSVFFSSPDRPDTSIMSGIPNSLIFIDSATTTFGKARVAGGASGPDGSKLPRAGGGWFNPNLCMGEKVS